jgi:hypothetical protein
MRVTAGISHESAATETPRTSDTRQTHKPIDNAMMVQDSLTGYVHEVPDIAEAPAYDGFGNPIGFLGRRRRRRAAPGMSPEGAAQPEAGPGAEEEPGEVGETVYDGFGNPIGFNPFKAIGSAIRNVGSMVASPFRAVGNLVSRGPGGLITALPAAGLLLPALLSRLNAQRQAIAQYTSTGQPVPPYLLQSYRNLLAQYRSRSAMRRPWPRGWRRPPLPYTGLGPRRLYMRCAVWPGPKGLVPGYAVATPGMQMQQIAQQAAMRAAGMMGRRRRGRRRRR